MGDIKRIKARPKKVAVMDFRLLGPSPPAGESAGVVLRRGRPPALDSLRAPADLGGALGQCRCHGGLDIADFVHAHIRPAVRSVYFPVERKN